MNNFFLKLGKNPIYKKIMKEPLTYVAGAVLLAVLQIAHFTLFESGWGVTSALADWGAWIYQAFGGDVSSWGYFANEKSQATLANGFMKDGGTWRNIGIIFGALLAALYASEFKLKKIKSKKQVVAAILGGLLMGYGARLASGCNIGALFTGTAAMSLSGWVFALFLLVGAFFGSRLLMKFFM